MKYLDEYRDPRAARALVEEIHQAISRPWRLMEVCGGQTHNLMRFGIDRSLPAGLELIHGPGCPVCLATVETIDRALQIASQPGLIFCTLGDLLRVPGSRSTLASLRSAANDIRVVYSPLDALGLARKNPDREVVFFAVGFETTAPTTASAVLEAERLGLSNFSVFGRHKRLASALNSILERDKGDVHAMLAPAHLCSVMGTFEYESMAQQAEIPVVITGFEPVDLLEGILRAVKQLERGAHEVENLYPRSVKHEGNPQAKGTVETVFEHADTSWRGLGTLQGSSLALREGFSNFDAEVRFPLALALADLVVLNRDPCQAGEVMTGRIKPTACPAFGGLCTPDQPRGGPMVSAEGTCAAYYRYRERTEIKGTSQNPKLSLVPNTVTVVPSGPIG